MDFLYIFLACYMKLQRVTSVLQENFCKIGKQQAQTAHNRPQEDKNGIFDKMWIFCTLSFYWFFYFFLIYLITHIIDNIFFISFLWLYHFYDYFYFLSYISLLIFMIFIYFIFSNFHKNHCTFFRTLKKNGKREYFIKRLFLCNFLLKTLFFYLFL